MGSQGTGAVRTGWNAAIAAAIIVLIQRLTGWELDGDDPVVAVLVVPAIGFAIAFFYRLSRLLADRWHWIAVLLFGIAKTPEYRPVDPPPPADDAGYTLIEVGVFLVCLALVLFLVMLAAGRV